MYILINIYTHIYTYIYILYIYICLYTQWNNLYTGGAVVVRAAALARLARVVTYSRI